MKGTFLFIVLLFVSITLPAQDVNYARELVNKLSAKEMWGRGYTNNGMKIAASFISNTYKEFGLKPLNGDIYEQFFYYPVNTFPGKMEVSINDVDLEPGKDFIIFPESSGKEASVELIQKDSDTYINPGKKIFVVLKDKLTWSVAKHAEDYTGIALNKCTIDSIPKYIKINIENLFNPKFEAANICGIVPGTAKPDSLIVLTAHYDHLGGMGSKTYFPGANDNASGVAFLLDLAKYYVSNPQPYSIAFICFGAEEAGLVGSKYFTENPLIALDKIKMLINIDMIGTGQGGITVVNATLHNKEFALLNKINDANNYMVSIRPRGKAANSDHYHFTEKGVPALFIYTLGGISAYHDVDDRPDTLPLTKYQNLFKLFLEFNKELMKSH